MKCDNCYDQIPDPGISPSDAHYGVISIAMDYYPSVLMVCPECLSVAEKALETHKIEKWRKREEAERAAAVEPFE